MKKRVPVAGELDKIIGQRIRSFRLAKGMSQEELGIQLGVTFQQVQKYENGKNRLSGSRLITVAKVLGTSVEQIVGSSGPNAGNKNHGEYLAALSEPPVIALVRKLERLPKSKRRGAGDNRSHRRYRGIDLAAV